MSPDQEAQLAAPAEPAPQLIVTGERVALGPLRADLVPLYAGWLNILEVARGLGNTIIYTVEGEKTWYEEAAKPNPGQALFTVYDRFDLVPIGTTGLINIDHQHRTATFGILLGERRGQGLGTETTRLVLDWAFTVLGLHNVDLRVFAWNKQAIHCYQKAGFRQAGLLRGGAVCMGRRFDVVIMDAIAEEFTGSVLADLVPERCTPASSNCRAATGGLPTRQVVALDWPHPPVELVTIAATLERGWSSPAVPSACP